MSKHIDTVFKLPKHRIVGWAHSKDFEKILLYVVSADGGKLSVRSRNLRNSGTSWDTRYVSFYHKNVYLNTIPQFAEPIKFPKSWRPE